MLPAILSVAPEAEINWWVMFDVGLAVAETLVMLLGLQVIDWKVGLTTEVGAVVLIPMAKVCVELTWLLTNAVMLYVPGFETLKLFPIVVELGVVKM